MVEEQKVWGSVKHLFDGPVSVSVLRVGAGAYCSIHKHNRRWNHFLVVSGEIDVITYGVAGEYLKPITKCTLSHLSAYVIPPGILHRFEVKKSGQVVETYWTSDGLNAEVDDIHRIEMGGRFDEKH